MSFEDDRDDQKYGGLTDHSQIPTEDIEMDPEQARKNLAALNEAKYSEEAKAIRDSKWRQLRCKTTTMTYGVTWVKCIYIIVAVICIPLGVVTYNVSHSVAHQEFSPYNDVSSCKLTKYSAEEDWGKNCTVNYTINHNFEPPIYFHYKLHYFYQNHRSYVKSRSETQLQNENTKDVSNCDPSDVQSNENNKKMLPCGLIANSFFNDKFRATLYSGDDSHDVTTLCNDTNTCDGNEKEGDWSDYTWYSSPNWEIDGIAWESDKRAKFKSTKQTDGTSNVNLLQSWQNVTLPDTNDEDFIVWMRTATLDKFTKLHRIIKQKSFKKGDILSVNIRNYFDVSSFGGKKSIVISTNSALGGRNDVLAIGYMIIGSLALVTAVFFRILIPPKSCSPYAS